MSAAPIMGSALDSRDGQATAPHRVVVLLVVNRVMRARATGALRDAYAVRTVDHVAKLQEMLLAARGQVSAVILESRDQAGLPCAPSVARIREQWPAVALLGYCAMQGDGADDVIALVRAGVHDVVFRDLDDVGIALRSALERAQRSTTAARVIATLRPRFPADALRLVEHCAVYGQSRLTVDRVATALGISRRTLFDWCVRAGLPAPQRLIAWCRLFLVAGMLEHPGYTVEYIATQLDYPSGPALHNALHRHLRQRAQDVRRDGGLRVVLDAFQRECTVGHVRSANHAGTNHPRELAPARSRA